MKRHPSLAPISRDHHKVLLLAQLLKKDAPDYRGLPTTPEGKAAYALNLFDNLIEKHEQLEEEILFIQIRGRSGEIDALVEELVREHRKIGNYVEKLRAGNNDPELMHELGLLLEKHVRKEERMLLEKVQQAFEEEELKKMGPFPG